jgi:hypothetical protein
VFFQRNLDWEEQALTQIVSTYKSPSTARVLGGFQHTVDGWASEILHHDWKRMVEIQENHGINMDKP